MHSSSEGRKKLYTSSFGGFVVSVETVDSCLRCSSSNKWTSGSVDVLLVVATGDRCPSGCCLALFVGGESLDGSVWFDVVIVPAVDFFSMINVLQSYLLSGSTASRILISMP